MADMIGFNDKQLLKYEKDLERLRKKSIPFAVKNTLDSTAFNARKIWQHEIDNRMIQRNKFTRGSIRVEKSRIATIETMESKTGSIADYMDEQEFGGVKVSKGKHGVVLPTKFSSGEGRGSSPRKRLPRAANKFKKIRLSNSKSIHASKRQMIFLAAAEAATSGQKYVFLDLGAGRKGIYKVTTSGRRPSKNSFRGLKLRMQQVHNLSRKTVKIPKNPTMIPAANQAQREMPKIYKKSLQFQLKNFTK